MRSVEELELAAKEMRKDIIQLAYGAGKKGAHISPSLSIVDIMVSLFLGCFRENDVFILSKGMEVLVIIQH